jgi:hypothetical protein
MNLGIKEFGNLGIEVLRYLRYLRNVIFRFGMCDMGCAI